MKKVFFLYIVLAFIAFTQAQAQQTKRVFLIGNSVTDGINYGGFNNMALSQGHTHIWGRHMIPGSPLYYLWNNRSDNGGFTTAPFGGPGNAFPNYDWDAVTLQPFDRGIEGEEGDKTAMLNYAGILKDRNPDVQLYIYSRYPRCPGGDSQIGVVTAEQWTTLWNRTDGAQESRKYFEDLMAAFNSTDKGGLNKDALLIPVGDVMHALNEKAMAGTLPGITRIWDVYDDGIHVNNIGSYIIMGTFYSTIYKEDIRNTKTPATYGTINAELLAEIQQTIYDVVFTHPYSGTTFDDLVDATGIKMEENTLAMNIFNRQQLKANVLPANASKRGIIWSSDNTGVAMVDSKGRVTALEAGTATITATSFDGGFTDECVVTVSGTMQGESESGILAGWDFNDKTEANGNKENYNHIAAAETLSGITTTEAYIGPGMRPDNNWDRGLTGYQQTMLTLEEAVPAEDYIGFTLKAEEGKLLSVTRVQFAPISQDNSTNTPRTFTLFSSVKGFTAGMEIGSCTKYYIGEMFSFDVTGHNYVTEIEFRVYIHGIAGEYNSTGIGSHSGNSFIVTGSILTPENDPPTTPGNLRAIQVTDINISCEWDEATDDYFVKGYNIYLNATKINSELIEETNFNIEGLTSGQLCNIEVEAVDYFNIASVTKGSLSIHANRPPVAAISASATNGEAPVTISFGSDSSTDPDEDDYVLGFDWYVDGEIQPDNGHTLNYTFTRSGNYEVSLVVMDSRGMRSTTSAKVTVNITAPKYAVVITGGKTVPEATEAEEGDEVAIKANEPTDGMVFERWTSNDVEFDDATAAETTFTMPAKPVTVTAEFKSLIGAETGEIEAVSLFPNPAKSHITIMGASGASFSIIDATGAEVLSGTVYGGENIPVASLTPGYYIFRTEGKALPFVKK